MNLSNALNACLARPCNATIRQEMCNIAPHRGSVVPSIRRLITLREDLGPTIVGYQDKNAGQCTLECPVLQHRREKASYYDDIAHFERTPLDLDAYAALMQSIHSANDWHFISPFPAHGKCQIPYAYAFQKAKDIAKNRIIVSYFHHPLKKIYNYGSRALTFILKHANLDAFTLWNVKDMTSTLRQFMSEMGGRHGPHTRYLTYCADVKEMYTGLPHDVLLRSIAFAIDRCATTHRQGRRRRVRLERRAHGSILFGRGPPLQDQFVTLTFDQIKAICRADVTTCFFETLGVVLRQFVGVPPWAYAICICMYYEHQFHSSVFDWCRLANVPDAGTIYRFMRYVDDVLGFVAYDARFPESKAFARLIVDRLTTSYHPNMILKEEPSAGWFPFLEGLVHIADSTDLSVRYHNKNFTPLLTTGKPKLYTTQHRTSFQSRAQAVKKLVGAIHRLRRVSLDPVYRIIDTIELFLVMRHDGYSTSEFGSALEQVSNKLTEPFRAHMEPVLAHLRF